MTKKLIIKNKNIPKKTKKNPNKLTFIEHAQELRKRLIFSFLIIIIVFFIIFYFSKPILQFLIEPLNKLGYKLYAIKVQETFLATMKASFFASIIISSPIWLWLLIGFIIPALNKKEKRMLFFIIFFSITLLICGFAFSYKILIPISLNYFLLFSKDEIQSLLSFGFYLDFFLLFFFATGIGFQLPLVILFLSKINLISFKILSKGRKYAIIILLIIAAILTPTPDMLFQIILFIPLYLLYEVSLILVFFFGKKE